MLHEGRFSHPTISQSIRRVNHLVNHLVNHFVNHQLFSQPATERFLPAPLHCHTGYDRIHVGRFSHPTISQSLQRVNQSVNHRLFSKKSINHVRLVRLYTGTDTLHVRPKIS